MPFDWFGRGDTTLWSDIDLLRVGSLRIAIQLI